MSDLLTANMTIRKVEAQIGHPEMGAFARAVAAAESHGELENKVQEAISLAWLSG